MKNILLLGGSGFIGQNLSEKLVAENYNLLSFGRSKGLQKNIIHISGDVRSYEKYCDIFSEYDVDCVINLLNSSDPLINDSGIEDIIDINLTGFINLLNAMEKYEVRNLIYISSGGAIYGEHEYANTEDSPTQPISLYGWLKLACENYLSFHSKKNENIKYLILRPSNIYGKYQKNNRLIPVVIERTILGKEIDIYGDLNTCKDYMYVEDFCDVISEFLKNKEFNNEIYNVGSGIGTTIKEIVEIAQVLVGRDAKIKYHDNIKGDVKHSILDISKLRRVIKRENNYSIENGMAESYKYIKSNLILKPTSQDEV